MPPQALPFAASSVPAQEVHRQATTWLVISIASSIFCLGLGLGAGGAFLCYLALQAAGQGNVADAAAKLRWGKILTLVGSGFGVLFTSLFLIFR